MVFKCTVPAIPTVQQDDEAVRITRWDFEPGAVTGWHQLGTDRVDLYRRAATYADRILRGEKPGDLPYQQPTKYDLVINSKTAKENGLTIPPRLLFTADEVIE